MKNRFNLLLIFAAVSILCAVLSGSIFFLATIEEEAYPGDARQRLRQWEANDPFVPPVDGRISPLRFQRFLLVNNDLSGILQKVREKFEESNWRIGFELIKMHPEWAQQKYTALRRHRLSPREYDWMARLVIRFWINRWQKESLPILNDFGWQPDQIKTANDPAENQQIFLSHETELNRIFDILWPERPRTSVAD